MTYPGTIPKTFMDIWQESANNPTDPRHELAKLMIARRHPVAPKPEPKTKEQAIEELNTEHDPIDEEPVAPVPDSIKVIPAKLAGPVHKLTPEKQAKLDAARALLKERYF